jgi:septum formation protein
MSAQFLLASRSPRRRELLRQVGFAFDVIDVDVPEVPLPGEAPRDYALRIALAKARAGAQGRADLPVLGADTDVVLDGNTLGKPRDREDALRMLALLSGRTHEVHSAVAVVAGARQESILSVTQVSFGVIAPQQASAYWDSGEPADKAGAYAIQGRGALFVRALSGSYSGVVGLPLYETAGLLARFDVHPSPGSRVPSPEL